jgi:hypothetical protein
LKIAHHNFASGEVLRETRERLRYIFSLHSGVVKAVDTDIFNILFAATVAVRFLLFTNDEQVLAIQPLR